MPNDSTPWLIGGQLVAFAMIIGMKIVLFVIGYKVVKLGHDLLAAGVKGEFKFKMNATGFKSDLASASPGLLFVLLGVLLCGYGIACKKPVSIEISPQQEQSAAPRLEPPDGELLRPQKQ